MDIAFPTGVLVDDNGIVRWVYEAELGHMRMTPADLFEALERLTLEEQNRELKRGRSVSKVVRQVFLMERPEDLALAIDVMQRELRLLGMQFSLCGVAIVDRDERTVRTYSATEDGSLDTKDISAADRPEVAKLITAWKEGRVLTTSFEDGDAIERAELAGLRWLVSVPFSHGVVFVGTSEPEAPRDDHVGTLTEFADAISAAFQRFVDFHELERRNQMLQEAQLQLIQSEKMASLGQLVAGVAHELNTPMGAIQSNVQTEARTLSRVEERLGRADTLSRQELDALVASFRVLSEMNSVSDSACRRMTRIVDNLRRFARLDESEWKSSDLREGLEETLALVEHQTKGRITIEREYGHMPLVHCYAGQLNQVFMNLVVNAIQAIEERGVIRVETRRDGDHVVVRISDDGAGIAAADLSRVFDPGFTTKGVGVGTGLGLAICYRIVQTHGGTMSAESKPSKGSVFTVVIPLSTTPPRAAERDVLTLFSTPLTSMSGR